MVKTSAKKKSQISGTGSVMNVWKEGKAYVAHAPHLDLSSCGDSPTRAKDHLREAAALFLDESAPLLKIRNYIRDVTPEPAVLGLIGEEAKRKGVAPKSRQIRRSMEAAREGKRKR